MDRSYRFKCKLAAWNDCVCVCACVCEATITCDIDVEDDGNIGGAATVIHNGCECNLCVCVCSSSALDRPKWTWKRVSAMIESLYKFVTINIKAMLLQTHTHKYLPRPIEHGIYCAGRK